MGKRFFSEGISEGFRKKGKLEENVAVDVKIETILKMSNNQKKNFFWLLNNQFFG